MNSEPSPSFMGFIYGAIKTNNNLESLIFENCKLEDCYYAHFQRSLMLRKQKIQLLFKGDNNLSEDTLNKINGNLDALSSRVQEREGFVPDNSSIATSTYKTKELFNFTIDTQNQHPRIKLLDPSGRILPLQDFYCCLKCDKVHSNISLKREIAFTYCKLAGDTTTYKGLGNTTLSQTKFVCPICMTHINITPFKNSQGDVSKQAFQCTYCFWNSGSVGISDPDFGEVFKNCKQIHKDILEVRSSEIKQLQKVFSESFGGRAHLFHLTDTPFGIKNVSREKHITWKKENLTEHIKTTRLKIETQMQKERIFRYIHLHTGNILEPGVENDESSSESEKEVANENGEGPSKVKYLIPNLGLFADFVKDIHQKQPLEEVIERYVREFPRRKEWHQNVFERLPIKYYKGDKSVFPLLGETQGIFSKKCPDCNVAVVNYQSFTTSYKKRFQSLFKEHSPVLKVYRIFKHPSIENALVYQFYAYNLTESKIEFTYQIDNALSKGAHYDFGDKTYSKSMVLEKKRDCTPADRSKVFKTKIQIIAEKEQSFQSEKLLVCDYKLRLMKEEGDHILETKLVIELGDWEVDRQLCLRYRHQFKYKRAQQIKWNFSCNIY